MITEIVAKKILTHHSDPFPTHWDVNPYRGCSIGCKYCFAQYTHKYLGAESFFRDIFVKINADECLKKELSAKKWNKEQIKIGGTTDLYQHSEEKYAMVPKLLKTVHPFRNPVFLQTKSTLILRDFDLISHISKNTDIDVATSVTAMDEKIRRIIEPGASNTSERIKMLGTFKGHCRHTILGIMPIIPYLTDNEENLHSIFSMAKDMKVDYVVTSFLFLRGEVKNNFLKMVENYFPHQYLNFKTLYKTDYPTDDYLKEMKKIIHKLMLNFGFTKFYSPPQPKPQCEQMSLF